MKNIIEKVDTNKILEFIESNFNASNKVEKVKDFRKLVNYFAKEDIKLSLEDADTLLKKSSKLVDTIELIQEENISNVSTNSIENLFLANDLLKDIKDNTYLVDSSFMPKLGKKNDLDTFKLYLTSMPRLLTLDEEKALIERISQGDEEAKRILVEHNLRLAVSVAKRYTNSGVSLPDLVQEGNIGLMMAANKFNKAENCKFSTYAVYWIKQRITRYIADNSRTVRIPVYMHDFIQKVERTKKSLSLKTNGEVTREDLANALNVSVEEIMKAEKYASGCVSLETKINPGDESDSSELSTFVADENAYFEGKVLNSVYYDELNNAIFNGNVLDDKAKKILQYRYGFVDGKVRTLEEIGKMFGVTRERIRQIEAKSLRMLEKSGTLKEFRPEEKELKKNQKHGNARGYNLILSK